MNSKETGYGVMVIAKTLSINHHKLSQGSIEENVDNFSVMVGNMTKDWIESGLTIENYMWARGGIPIEGNSNESS